MPRTPQREAPHPTQLQAPLARLLRPLVRLLIRSGVTFPMLADLLRQLYVNVAEHDFALEGKDQTDSRVSLLTGIHRKEVSRLRGAGAPVSTVPAALSRSSRIIARWLADPAFTDRNGRPLPLLRMADDGPSFEALVSSVTRDVRPRAILDEWLDRRMVEIDADDRIVLVEGALIPAPGGEQQLYYFGRNMHDHMAAAVANILETAPPYFERGVHYDGLSQELALVLEKRSRALAIDIMKEANRAAHDGCVHDAGGRWRWNFGVYVYLEDTPLRRAEAAEGVTS